MNEYLFAEVVVDNSSKNTDKTFTYSIPQKYVSGVDVGMRVLVPFGFGNKTLEGIIVNLKENVSIDENKIKNIIRPLEKKPLLSKHLINLGIWMRSEYLATYNDVFKTILPTGISNKISKYVKLDVMTKENLLSNIKSKNQSRIVEFIINNGDSEISSISSSLNIKNIHQSLNFLEKKGIITIYEKIDTGVSKKYEKHIRCYENINIDEIINSLDKRAYKQKEILEFMKDKKTVSFKNLSMNTGATLSTIKTLQNKEILDIIELEVKRNPITKDIKKTKNLKFTFEQQNCFDEIYDDILNNTNNKFLIHGVTGSGKTEIYLQIIEKIININKQAIVLVPEISLTPQTVERFVSRFGDKVAIMHSRLSLGERYDEWRKVKENDVNIVVGARSAIFAPFDNLGLIIIDEEHETSYKSNMNPKYDTIEVAKKRCELEGSSLILGSATPSIDSYYRALNKEIKLLTIKNRVNNMSMPEVEVVDMKKELNDGNKSILSRKLYKSIYENLKQKKQTMIFLNRRGFSSFMSCRSCGHVIRCNNCDISLTFHKTKNLLQCHYCGVAKRIPNICPECGSKYIKHFGIGTQKVEDNIKSLFPSARIERMDIDTTSKKGSHEKILDKVKNGEVDILIGTQMITKGLDFPNVTLVGIIAADMSLNLPDYKASERTFQLITQVSGRAGRGDVKGSVILQTYQPDHYSLQFSKNHDFVSFYNNEIILREEFNYPPFTNIINIIISGEDENLYNQVEILYSKLLNEIKSKLGNFIVDDILGPNPAPISKIKGRYRWQILIKCIDKDKEIMKDIVYNICIKNIEQNKKSLLRYSIEINPNSIM